MIFSHDKKRNYTEYRCIHVYTFRKRKNENNDVIREKNIACLNTEHACRG